MSWSEVSPPVKPPGKERQRPTDAVNRTPGPPKPTPGESKRGWYLRLAFYLLVAVAVISGVVAISLAGI